MQKFLLAAILCASLSACGTTPKAINKTPEGNAYTFDGSNDQLKDVNDKASTACAKAGKVAVLKNVSKTDDSSIAHFDCE